jgi:glycyl-tRNA synthetase
MTVWEKVFAVARRRGFIWPAFDIYGGMRGFYDYGPLGAELKRNILDTWRKYYVFQEGMAEIDSPNLSPEEVFRASGHLDKFEDLITACEKCSASFRADHLVSKENADTMSAEELFEEMKKEGVRCPECGGPLSKPEPFNLMFKTSIGPKGKRERTGYFRPETAQAMFMDFPYLYRYFREKLPFGAVQIGKGFRNEISPRQGLLRLREFNMAEAEVFFDPENKRWPGFERYADDEVLLLPNTGGELRISLRAAVDKGIIKNEALAYFVGLTRSFLLEIGIDEKKLRFREHLQDEMAHYADDCWDAEVLLSYGWTEIIGIADRTDYDLSRHMRFSGASLKAKRYYETPKEVETEEIIPNFGELGPLFRGDAKKVGDALKSMDASGVSGEIRLEIDGKEYVVPESAYTIKKLKKKVSGEDFVPHVIEPSHGIDRILYAVLEHSYSEVESEGETYRILRLRPSVAPVKVGVFPLMAKDGLDKKALEICDVLRNSGIKPEYDASGSIGRRYARMDEIGTPYCITVDYQSLEDETVTLRYRDSKEQVRVEIKEIPERLTRLIKENTIN